MNESLMIPVIIIYSNESNQGWSLFGQPISTFSSIATLIATIIAGLGIYLTLKQQMINLNLAREGIYLKEMDKLINKLYINRERSKQFEPQYVNPNNPDEVERASEFWKDISENKYLATGIIHEKIDEYLNRINKHKQNIGKHRIILSEIIKSCRVTILDNTSIESLMKLKLTDEDKPLVKPIPFDDLQKEEYLKTWGEILATLDKDPNNILREPAYNYFNALIQTENGPESLIELRRDLARMVETRYNELDKKIEKIKLDLENNVLHYSLLLTI